MFTYEKQKAIVVTVDSGGSRSQLQGIDEVNELLESGGWEVAQVTPTTGTEGSKQVVIMVLGKIRETVPTPPSRMPKPGGIS